MDGNKCTECHEPADSLDQTKCDFHASIANKRRTPSQLAEKLRDAITDKRIFNFRGFIFPGGFDFPSIDVNIDADFTKAEFHGGLIRIRRVRFLQRVLFERNVLTGSLLIEDVAFDGNPSFQFRSPDLPYATREATTLTFARVNFRPNATFFQQVCLSPPNTTEFGSPVVLFRGCCLKDVYFDSCDMGLFSFFGSSFFEDAQIVACSWPSLSERLWRRLPFSKHTREYALPEEWLLQTMRSNHDDIIATESFCNLYGIPQALSYKEIAAIYRRLKTALDRAKAYEEAAWLYFNEIEMRRLAWRDEFQMQEWTARSKKLPPLAWNLIYTFYKVTAGYGERPLNSAIALPMAIMLFACAHLLNGITSSQVPINYDFSINPKTLDVFFSSSFWLDWLECMKYSLVRSVPIGYLPLKASQMTPSGNGLWDIFLSLLNTATLTVLLVFVGIGLKRHFKRF